MDYCSQALFHKELLICWPEVNKGGRAQVSVGKAEYLSPPYMSHYKASFKENRLDVCSK